MLATIILLASAWVWAGYVYLNMPAPIPQEHLEHLEAYQEVCPIGTTPIIPPRVYSAILTGNINLTAQERIIALNCCRDMYGAITC